MIKDRQNKIQTHNKNFLNSIYSILLLIIIAGNHKLMKINKVGVFFYVADLAEEQYLLTFEGLVYQIRQKPIKNNPSKANFIVFTSHM